MEAYNEKNEEKVVYIIGSITGNPDYFNHFDRAERELKGMGYDKVINPTAFPVNLPYERYAPISIGCVQACDVVCCLEGWENSKGARVEYSYAVMSGKKIISESKNYTTI